MPEIRKISPGKAPGRSWTQTLQNLRFWSYYLTFWGVPEFLKISPGNAPGRRRHGHKRTVRGPGKLGGPRRREALGRPWAKGLEGTRLSAPLGPWGLEATCLSPKIAGGCEPKRPPGAEGTGGYETKRPKAPKIAKGTTIINPHALTPLTVRLRPKAYN